MRVSRLMLVTLRDAPSDAEIISHQLLIRGGFIRKIAGGIYAYMPLMWLVLKKIISIVEEELNAIGCLQTLLPQLHPAEIWQKSGRWKGYTDGEGIMFHLKDRQGKEFGLGPTHEEIITQIASEIINSYKQLPINIYQIQTKFRDEIRPRFGLMRSREFIMKDAYSFHVNEEDLKSTYNKMNLTYKKIFNRCGLQFVAVDADSGAIGGASSQEFMVTAEAGEDLILRSDDNSYAANQEKAISNPKKANILEVEEPFLLKTPNQKSIEEICLHQKLDATQIIKVLLYLAITEDGIKQPLLISIRGDQELNEVKLLNFLSVNKAKSILDLIPIEMKHLDLEGIENIPFGYIGPDLNDLLLQNAKSWEKNFLRITDKTASNLQTFVCGANKPNEHKVVINWDSIQSNHHIADIRKAKSGDTCIHDKDQRLHECRGIEIGHIFQLGRKYSKMLNATFTTDKGHLEPVWMGCYGIGISRLAQAAVEQNHDKEGIIWPTAIAPFEVIIVVANIKNEDQKNLGENIYQELKQEGIDALLDDRDERAGLKFNDADLIGIPWRIVVGRDANACLVELHNRRTKETTKLKANTAKQTVKEAIKKEKILFAP